MHTKPRTIGFDPLNVFSPSSHLRLVSSTRRFRPKERLPLAGNLLWRIEAGVVRCFTWNEEGRTMTLGFWGTGAVVGQPLSQMNPYVVECLTDVEVCELLPDDRTTQQTLLTHIWRNEELLSIVHCPSATERLLRLLEWLSDQFGCPMPQGTLLTLSLTHQDIADTISTTRVTVTRLINRFEREERIKRLGRDQILYF